jgi:hypothetical protein
MSGETTKAATTLQRVKAEIDGLFELQAKALKAATYLGMTPEEAKEVDERRKRITHLMHQMYRLKQSELSDR